MSMMLCDRCQLPVVTDDDPDSRYVPGHDCLCEWCRDKTGKHANYDYNPHVAGQIRSILNNISGRKPQ